MCVCDDRVYKWMDRLLEFRQTCWEWERERERESTYEAVDGGINKKSNSIQSVHATHQLSKYIHIHIS